MAETARSRASEPRLRQLSFFLPNRLGALFRATQHLERESVRICGLSLLDATDHVVVRMIVNRPAVAKEQLEKAGYPVYEAELLGVALPATEEFGIRKVLSGLLGAEINIAYAYALIVQVDGHPVLALKVDDMGMATRVVQSARLALVDQAELGWEERG
jgi:hypothetical protein